MCYLRQPAMRGVEMSNYTAKVAAYSSNKTFNRLKLRGVLLQCRLCEGDGGRCCRHLRPILRQKPRPRPE